MKTKKVFTAISDIESRIEAEKSRGWQYLKRTDPQLVGYIVLYFTKEKSKC